MGRRSVRPCGKTGWRLRKSYAVVGRTRSSTAKTDMLALPLFSAQFLARVFRQSSALRQNPSMSSSKLEAYSCYGQTFAGGAVETPATPIRAGDRSSVRVHHQLLQRNWQPGFDGFRRADILAGSLPS